MMEQILRARAGGVAAKAGGQASTGQVLAAPEAGTGHAGAGGAATAGEVT